MEALKLIFVFHLVSRGAFSKSTSQSSQDILQSNVVKREVRAGEGDAERCDLDPKAVEGQFTNYVQKFSDSESGKFLQDLMKHEKVSQFSRPITNLLERMDKEHLEKLNQVTKEPVGRTWTFVSLGLSGLYAVLMAYLTMVCPLSNYTVLTISSYVFGSIVMGLGHDLVPLWVVCAIGVVGDIIVWFLLSLLSNIKRRQVCILSICMVFAKMVYDMHAMIPLEYLSPNYTGICGAILTYILRVNNFMFLRLAYLVFLLLVTASTFIRLPSFVAGEPMELQEIDMGASIMKRLICFVSALPAAGFCSEVYCAVRKIANPLGPMTYFVVPTKFRYDGLETYLGIGLWVAFALTYYEMIKHSSENHLLTPPKKRRSWREYTRTISRI